MNLIAFPAALLAAVPPSPVDKTTGLVFRDVLLILGALVLLTAILIFWARYYARRPKRHRHERRSVSRRTGDDRDHDASGAQSHHHHHRRHRRRRRRRREHRGRNPTLAETGGLPPLRPEPTPKPPA